MLKLGVQTILYSDLRESCKTTGALHSPGLPYEDLSMSTHFSPQCFHYNHPLLFPLESPTWMFNYRSFRWPSGIQQSISVLLQTAFEVISLNQLGFFGSGRGRMGNQEILRDLFCVDCLASLVKSCHFWKAKIWRHQKKNHPWCLPIQSNDTCVWREGRKRCKGRRRPGRLYGKEEGGGAGCRRGGS